ncbi:hypothetical protein DH2020_023624 [Rehmannia glutinosa]|uniref:Uncharacterized protein n=1 Tax=Rehmannia glutinosa TaxID=99300 RepID=A0ABR0W966_REHGL
MGNPTENKEAQGHPSSQRRHSKERRAYRPVHNSQDKGKIVVNSMDDTVPSCNHTPTSLPLGLVFDVQGVSASSNVRLGNSFAVLAEEDDQVNDSPPSDALVSAPEDTQPLPMASLPPQSGVRNQSHAIEYPLEKPIRLLSKAIWDRSLDSDRHHLQRDVALGPKPPIHQFAITRDLDGDKNLNIAAAKRWADYVMKRLHTIKSLGNLLALRFYASILG